MRIVLRVLAASVVLVIVGVVGLAVALPRLAESPEMRARIEQASVDLLGRPLSYDSLSAGILPPRIMLSSPRVPGGDPDAPPLLEAARVDLRIALLPLLGFAIVIDSLEIEGLEVEITRTEAGYDLPLPPAPDPGTEPTPGSEAEGNETLLHLGIRHVVVRDSRLLVIDTHFTPPARIGYESLLLEAKGTSPDAPVSIEASADLTTGGHVVISGTATLDGVVDLVAEVENASLAAAAVYLEEGTQLDATVSGRLEVRGQVAGPERVGVDVLVTAARVATGETTLEGPIAIQADLKGEWAALTGSFALDATAARVVSGEAFVKPVGTKLAVAGRLGADANGATVVGFEPLELASMRATGRVVLGDDVRIALDADSFPAADLLALSPAAAGTRVSGALSIHGLTARLEPLSIGGALQLAALSVPLEGGGAVDATGRIVGQGERLELVDFVITTGEQRVELTGDVRDLLGEQPFQVQFESDGVLRADALLTGLDPTLANTVYGPLTLRGKVSGLAGATGSETALTDSLVGDVSLDVGRTAGDGSEGGRIVGFSLLGSVFDGLEKFGQLTHISGLVDGDKKKTDLTQYSNDAFESVQVAFRMKDGQLETDRARLLYRTYAANLTGSVRLADLSLDMQGEVELGSQAAAALGASAKDGEIVVRVAHIGGTVAAPDVAVSKEAVGSLASQVLQNNIAVKGVLGSADKVVPGAGRIFGEGLGAILGGGLPKMRPDQAKAVEPAPESEKRDPAARE